ncbi:hypothetical protein NDA10_004187 [Ustilago hordei]|uniref:Deoxyribonuclease NucA/NucB domain-containing protein n=1 Tax=Ustilago hordei TaxID=120017 RepID=I2FQI3_USTHO|nr:uncharacterized protein UHO2_05253 [Ustilago hordei]KAJ1042860.1 hypothetical protein NDA10_004187 [Ustilago hordei]CCF49176.1 uncharacterized protein UHOR_13572 [Ustilago hordei]SYW80694.1 uncharacterized protein UHO2_05253 [Ustilago hordei]
MAPRHGADVPARLGADADASACAGKPRRLDRDSANASINRANTACRSPDHPITRSPKRCAGKPADSNSCDEYPYASSQEGGAGSVTRCVASTENSRQAGTLSSFYTNNGVIDRDAYNVAFASTPGLQYCSASCTNTGNQVTKRNLAIATQHIARHFFTDQGHQLTSNVRTSGQIETHAWLAHEERNVTIASDLASAP